ncbi:glycosyltransferase [Synechococcus elongatus]|uniref:glycosyltransferase n=1 Tax=Synechococcus elongatus TaxID=32046 RepID=UPI000F7E69A8|nr:glycosyltransferase [Synechococcus elongatus]
MFLGAAMAQVSLCMIVRDEAEWLPRCLASVKDQVDELIVLDTGSRDRTPAIATEAGAKLLHTDWADDFSAARNQAIAAATGDWILVLDADEELILEAWTELRSQLDQPEALAFTVLREETQAGQVPYSRLSRLFRNRPDIRFQRPYHELVDDSLLQLQEREAHWKITAWPTPVIRHYGYGRDRLQQRGTAERMRQSLETWLADHPEDAYLCSKLGGLLVQEGDLKAAQRWLKQGLKQGRPEPAVRYELLYHLALLERRQGDLDAAIDRYQAALQEPVDAIHKLGAWVNLSHLYRDRGQLGLAYDAARQAVAAAPQATVALTALGLAARAIGNYPEAIAAYQQALQLDPNDPSLYQNLGAVLFQVGQLEASYAAFRQAIAGYEQQGSPEAQRLELRLQAMGIRL